MFCRDLAEAEEYSREFNKRGYRTVWVSGAMPKDDVEDCIQRLESEECEYALDYIITADLFNEGVDIPAVNQVIMLRPTESPIIFIQQLGRGLRHYPGKDYVVILDFIGNYEKNYNIPMALSDDRSYSKTETRRFVAVGDAIIPGNSTISFDEISKKKIYESIDNSDFTEAKIIMGAYRDLKMRLGRIPRLPEYRMYGSIDAMNLLSKYKSYHDFLSRDKEYSGVIDQTATDYLRLITKIVAPGKRLLEVRSLELLLEGCEDLDTGLVESDLEINGKNIHNILSGKFYRSKKSLIQSRGGKYCCSDDFGRLLKNQYFYDHVKQIAELGRQNWVKFSKLYEDTDLVLNMRYTIEDACHYLNWPVELNGGCIGGYWYDKTTNTFPVFINYIKEENIAESQNYNDYFASRNTLVASSKDKEGRDSPKMKTVENAKSNATQIHLFVRKNKNDGKTKDFYYLGKVEFVRFLNDEKPVEIEYRLKEEVRADLYDYLNSV